MLTCCGWTPDPEFTVVPSFAFIIPVMLGTTIFRRVIEIGSCVIIMMLLWLIVDFSCVSNSQTRIYGGKIISFSCYLLIGMPFVLVMAK